MSARHSPDRAGRLVAALALLAVAGSAVACAGSPAPDASAAASILAGLPTPPAATVVVGGQGPGMDGDARFYAYTSQLDPAAEQAAYDAVLKGAGYRPAQQVGAWTPYLRAGVTVWVSVSVAGPPTSIIALVAADPRSAAVPADVADPTATVKLGDVVTRRPATPEPVTRPGSTPRPTSPGATRPPSGSPAPATASPSPAATPKPTAKPHPTQKPKPSHPVTPTKKPKPTPKPKHTPKPKASSATNNGGSTQ